MNFPLSRTVRSLCCLMLATTCWPAAIAQAPCDSLNEVGFTHTDYGAYNYSFSPITPSGGASFQGTEWGFLGEEFMDFSFAPQPQVTFPGMDDYLVCLRTTVQDDQTGACVSIHCELVSIPVDSACADVVAAFTISVQGAVIQFNDQSTTSLPFAAYAWDFGDGSTSAEVSPGHSYAGTGPYEACLTVSTATCSATACNWIYLGPSNVPCGTLLQPAIGVIQYEKTIAVFDQSITSGMNSSITWDFGDGATASGSPVIHTYMEEGSFEVCGEVDLWGPLTPDTCSGSACDHVFTYVATGIGTHGGTGSLHAFPVPFTGALTIEGAGPGIHWELMDVLGRIHVQGRTPANGPLVVQGSMLDAGSYLFHLYDPHGGQVLRVVKSTSAFE